ncbi:MAG: diacylglycerol kinase [Chloroflexota bacterium]
MRSRNRLASFRYAFAGLAYVLRTQRNMWIHAVIAVGVVALGLWLSLVEWALLVLTIALVFTAETANTIVETTIDLITQEHHPLAKVAKDVAAGAVLLSAMAAVVIGLLILGPRLWARIAPLIRPG